MAAPEIRPKSSKTTEFRPVGGAARSNFRPVGGAAKSEFRREAISEFRPARHCMRIQVSLWCYR